MTNSQKLDLILLKLEDHDQKFESIDQKFEGINQKFISIDKRLDGMDKRLVSLESDVKDIKLTLENEIRVNIQRVAEGHLDLSRKLQTLMKPNEEVEMLSIKVRILETDVNELKRKIS